MWLRVFCCLLCLYWLPAAAQGIYKTRDKDGNLVYTDRPPSAESEEVKLPPINTLPPNYPSAQEQPARDQEANGLDYQLKIISPRADVTIPPGQRDLAIAINLNRPLDQGHLLMYFLNGELLEETQSTSIIVRDVTRGSHTLTVEVVDANGKSLAAAPAVIVNVIRPIIKKPAASPSPKPKAG